MLQDVLDQLPQLSQKDLQQVQAHISNLLIKEVGGEAEPLYLVYTDLQKKQGQAAPPLSAIRRTKQFSHFKKGVAAVDTLIDKLHLRKIKRFAVATFLGTLCADYIKDRGMSLNLHSYSWSLTIVDEIIEKSFPGYAEAGLLGAIVDGKVSS